MLFRNQRGSAPIQFILLLLPTLAIPWLTWNLVIAGYLKLTLTDAAIEGARFAALADQSLESGKLRALQLINLATRGLAAANVIANESASTSGQRIVQIQIETYLPIRVQARAVAIAER